MADTPDGSDTGETADWAALVEEEGEGQHDLLPEDISCDGVDGPLCVYHRRGEQSTPRLW